MRCIVLLLLIAALLAAASSLRTPAPVVRHPLCAMSAKHKPRKQKKKPAAARSGSAAPRGFGTKVPSHVGAAPAELSPAPAPLSPAPAALLFPVSEQYEEHRGPAVAEHFRSASLEGLFGAETAAAFHGSPHFRAELLSCQTAVKCMFATQSFEATESWAFANAADILGCRQQGTFDAIRDSNRDQLDAVLSSNIGPTAPTAEVTRTLTPTLTPTPSPNTPDPNPNQEFVAAFVRTCGPRRRGMFTALSGAPPQNALEWHQDWGPPDAESHTVMLAFPPAEYAGADLSTDEGGGILTELVSPSSMWEWERRLGGATARRPMGMSLLAYWPR